MRALPVEVFRSCNGDCTNGGMSSRHDTLYVVCDDGFVDIDTKNPPDNLAKVVKRDFFGRTIYHIEPYAEPDHVGWMMGGNYAATPDSRFSKMIGGMYGAVAIHDRQETQELYDMLSR